MLLETPGLAYPVCHHRWPSFSWRWEGLWQCLACRWKYLVVNPQVLPSLLGGSVRHSKAPPLEVLGAHLLWGYHFFRCTPIGRGETSLQYGDVRDQVRKVRQAKE